LASTSDSARPADGAASNKRPPGRRRRTAWIVTLSVAVTAGAGVLLVNLLPGDIGPDRPIPSLYGVGDPEFSRAADALFGPPLLQGNDARALHNGGQIFPAMLEEIRHARRSVSFETYIYWSGRVGQEFSDALSERAAAGVRVHLILDAVGSGKMDAGQLDAMRAAGVQIEKYHPLRWYSADRINNRTHRKLLIVDGRVGFTGGVGIADKWDGDGQDPDHWRDNHYRLVGPAVAQLQSTFVEHWLATRGVLLVGDDYFPQLSAAGGMAAQMVRSSVDDGSESVRLLYLTSIAAARHSVWIENAYFVPDRLSIETLLAARRRGVDVQIIVPGPITDSNLSRLASRRRWGPLLEAGVAIYEFQPTMFHCKVMIVDDSWVTVGSTNFDNRSFHLNSEANLDVSDQTFARSERRAFEQDRARSRRVTLEEWRHRPRLERLGDWFAGLFASQL
jgi:cardiolipin synthase